MSSSRALTGGTNDVNPQPLKCVVTPTAITTAASGSAASGANTVALPIPVQRLSTGGRAQVMEILGFDWDVKHTSSNTVTFASVITYITLSTRSNGTAVPSMGCADPYSIAHVASQPYFGPGYIQHVNSGSKSLTDGAGHGVLFGMDTLYIQVGATVFASAASASDTFSGNINIWYRWKNVGFSEYVGMVTSS